MTANKLLSADRLFALMRAGFEQVSDRRAGNAKVSLPDALMSGFAMFSLKDPSLLAFDARRATDSNLQSIYGIEHVPGDTQMRIILDEVEPASLRPVFQDAIRQLERSKELDKFIFLEATSFRWMARDTLAPRRYTVLVVCKRSTRRQER